MKAEPTVTEHPMVGPLRRWANERSMLAAEALSKSDRHRQLADQLEQDATVILDYLARMSDDDVDDTERERLANYAAAYYIDRERTSLA
jgi:hypothetical protein